jgi:uncharacterized protein YndB with AHSA1/START domain
MESTSITVRTIIKSDVSLVWKTWISPEDILNWNTASDDWHTTSAENDFHPGGRFSYRMEAKDGSFGFDFRGTYDEININREIGLTLGDCRKVKIVFSDLGNKTEIVETFEAESINSIELQKTGWQSILDNFRKYTESK